VELVKVIRVISDQITAIMKRWFLLSVICYLYPSSFLLLWLSPPAWGENFFLAEDHMFSP